MTSEEMLTKAAEALIKAEACPGMIQSYGFIEIAKRWQYLAKETRRA